MKFTELSKNTIEAAGRFSQEQLAARKRRLENPALQESLERTKELLREDVKRVCKNGISAAWRFTLGGPLSALWEGTKEFGEVVSKNFSAKQEKDKRSYSDVPAAMITELLAQWAKGVVDTTKFVGNVGLALGRSTVLGGRHIIGK